MSSSPSSSSDLEQKMSAALRRVTPVAAAPAGAGGGAPDRPAAAAVQSRMDAQRGRANAAYPATLASARSLAEKTFSSPREQLKELKDELRDLQAQLSEALKLQLSKESKRRLAIGSISEATATNEELRSSIADFSDKRDIRAALISELLQAPESLEAESTEDAERAEKVPKTLLWFDNFLGFWIVVGEEGVKFVFDKIDPQHPEKECSFCVSPRLRFIGCYPHVKDIEELAKGLDLNEHLFKFVRMAREKFQSSFMDGTLPVSPVVGTDVSAAPPPAPMVLSVNNRSEDAHNQTQSPWSKNNVQLLPAKRGVTDLSGASPGVLRRSPRIRGNAES